MKKNYPNETIRVLHEHASCRNFSDKKIEPDVLRYILESGIHGPTGGNLQPYSIIKIEEKDKKEKLAELCEEQSFIVKAPIDLLFCIDLHRLKRWAELEFAPFTATDSFRHFWIAFQDTVICAQNICVAAESLGLGTVYIGSVLECLKEIKEMFQLPDAVFPVVLLCMGYPERELHPQKKLGVDVVVHSEKYREMDDKEILEVFNEKYSERKLEITEKRLRTIEETCRKAHGEKFAEKCIEKIKENGYINMAQYYFGVHYRADQMKTGNDLYLQLMEEFGFRLFKGGV